MFAGGGILNGRRKSILEVGNAIRTGVRLGSITKETALNSKILDLKVLPIIFTILFTFARKHSVYNRKS